MPDITLTERRLHHYANWYVTSHGYSFGQGADNDITTMTNSAAQKIHSAVTPGWPSLPDPQVDLEFRTQVAEAALGLFIDQMIAAWPNFNQPGAAAIVGEETFREAVKKLCPLWPIC